MPSEKTSGRHTPKGTSSRGVKGGRSATRSGAKGTGTKAAEDAEKSPAYAATGRYTPPSPRSQELMESPRWVAPVMFGLFLLGLLMIVLNLTEVLPGAPSNWYTLGGLAVILLGFTAATKLR